MPKMISNLDKLAIAKKSLDTPIPAIAKDFDLNVMTVRNILECEESQDFIAALKEARKTGFLEAARLESRQVASLLQKGKIKSTGTSVSTEPMEAESEG